MTSIAKRLNGRYRARYRDPDGRERAQHFDTKKAAERWLAQQIVKVGDGTWIDPQASKRTFGEYARRWAHLQVHHRPSTAEATMSRLERHLLPHFDRRPMASIQRSDIQAWVKDRAQHLAPSTLEVVYGLMATIMRSAVEDRVLSHTPCRSIRLPAKGGSRVRVPSEDELGQLLDAAPAHARALIVMMAGSGMRLGEATGVTVDRVDFLRRTITIDRQLIDVVAGLPRWGPPKTAASHRTVPVPAEVTDAIGAHLAAWPSTGLVFVNSQGRPWRRGTLDGEWKRWAEAVGVPMRPHETRHLYASALIADGQSVKVIQERLGHKSASTTLDTYGHLFPNDEDRTRDAIGRLLRASSGG